MYVTAAQVVVTWVRTVGRTRTDFLVGKYQLIPSRPHGLSDRSGQADHPAGCCRTGGAGPPYKSSRLDWPTVGLS
ncbi:hypothetical protein ACFXJM_24090 [Streptomyces massasporeus]